MDVQRAFVLADTGLDMKQETSGSRAIMFTHPTSSLATGSASLRARNAW